MARSYISKKKIFKKSKKLDVLKHSEELFIINKNAKNHNKIAKTFKLKCKWTIRKTI